jgi:uncharacterized membrane protein HdeD (DUF308 family)
VAQLSTLGIIALMKPRQAFGVAVRVLGLIIILVSVLYFVSAFIVCFDPTYRPNLSPAWHYFIDAVVELLIGLYLLRGAPHIVRYAFRDEDLDDKPDA